MMKEKWFYPIQKNLNDRLHSEFDHVVTLYQDITPDRVFEMKVCTPASGTGSKTLLCVMSKNSGRFGIFDAIEL